jgi:hypothetical protein
MRWKDKTDERLLAMEMDLAHYKQEQRIKIKFRSA